MRTPSRRPATPISNSRPTPKPHAHAQRGKGGAQVPLTDAHRRPLTPLYPSPTLTPTLVLTLTLTIAQASCLTLTLTLTLLQASCVSLDPYEAFGPVMWDVYK